MSNIQSILGPLNVPTVRHRTQGSKGDDWRKVETLAGLRSRASLKVGRLYGKEFATGYEAMDVVIDWLAFYNHRRLRSALGYISPTRFEANWRAGQAKQAAYSSG